MHAGIGAVILALLLFFRSCIIGGDDTEDENGTTKPKLMVYVSPECHQALIDELKRQLDEAAKRCNHAGLTVSEVTDEMIQVAKKMGEKYKSIEKISIIAGFKKVELNIVCKKVEGVLNDDKILFSDGKVEQLDNTQEEERRELVKLSIDEKKIENQRISENKMERLRKCKKFLKSGGEIRYRGKNMLEIEDHKGRTIVLRSKQLKSEGEIEKIKNKTKQIYNSLRAALGHTSVTQLALDLRFGYPIIKRDKNKKEEKSLTVTDNLTTMPEKNTETDSNRLRS
jgi:hypothetical protein